MYSRLVIKCVALIVSLIGSRESRAQVSIPETVRVKVNRLVRIEAKSTSLVKWINVYEDVDLIPDSSGKYATVLCAKVGKYKIGAFGCTKGEASEVAWCVIECYDDGKKEAPPKPEGSRGRTKEEVKAATVKLRIGNSGCTATIIGPTKKEERVFCVSASHCMPAAFKGGKIYLRDGREFEVIFSARDAEADLLALEIVRPDSNLPFAEIAKHSVKIGDGVWHNGYGFDKPSNVEEGKVIEGVNVRGQWKFRISVSNGDSGGGVFCQRTNALIGAVCCTTKIAGVGDVWGGDVSRFVAKRRDAGLFFPIVEYEGRYSVEESGGERRVFPVLRMGFGVEGWVRKKAFLL